jgi:hypothetical protein
VPVWEEGALFFFLFVACRFTRFYGWWDWARITTPPPNEAPESSFPDPLLLAARCPFSWWFACPLLRKAHPPTCPPSKVEEKSSIRCTIDATPSHRVQSEVSSSTAIHLFVHARTKHPAMEHRNDWDENLEKVIAAKASIPFLVPVTPWDLI